MRKRSVTFNLVAALACACACSTAVGEGSSESAASATLRSVVAEKVLPFGAPQVSSAVFAINEVDRLDVAADEAWRALGSKAAYDAYRLDMRKKMLAAIGEMPRRTPLNARTTGTYKRDGYTIEKVVFESMRGLFVTANLFVPDGDGKRPAVVMSCGHSDTGKDCDIYLRACVLAVKKGFVALMFDPYEQGERRWYTIGSTRGHNQIGIRAEMVGWSMPLLRIWDGMRAIDYIETRPEVDAGRIGYMGQSGGGTMTALMEAAEPRIRAAAPSCYLTSLSVLCHVMGPQDAEQNIYGQLSFGLNHTGYVLMPDIPVAVTCKFSDMFSYYGTCALFRSVEAVERTIGCPGRCWLNDAPGPHGWTEATEASSVAFLAQALIPGSPDPRRSKLDTRILDIGFDLEKADVGLGKDERGCTPGGFTKTMPGACDIYDVIEARASAAKAARRPLSAAEKADAVRRLAVIPSLEEAAARTKDWPVGTFEGAEVARLAVQYPDGAMLPAVYLKRVGVPTDVPVLVAAAKGRVEGLKIARRYLEKGHPVLVADVTGVGEVGREKHIFYRADERPDEGLGAMQYLIGKPLVGRRARDLLVLGDWLRRRTGAAPKLVATGFIGVPAAHAFAAERTAWSSIELLDAPASWEEALASRPPTLVYYADLVPRAYGAYDWTDLLGVP